MELQYKDILIRPIELEDSDTLLNWYNDGQIMAYDGYPNGKKTKKVIVEHYINHDTKHFRHMIEYQGKEIGEINYRDLQDNSCQLTVLIADKSYQNIGLGKIILSLFIDVLLYDYGYSKIKAEVYKGNDIAIHVLEKLGFKKIRENINNRSDTNGKPMSTIDYQLVSEDFNSFI